MFICLCSLLVLDESEARHGTHLPWYREMALSLGCNERWHWECGSCAEGQLEPMQRTGWRSDAVLFT